MNGARRALAFLTPFGGAATPAADAVPWFPIVGAGIGLVLGGIWWVAARLWAAPLAAAVVVAADLALTGMLHLDGLVDTADGLLPPLERSRRLEVMADPAAGAFGVGAAVAVLLLRWAALAALAPSALLLGALWCTSRLVMAVAARDMPYARPGGGLATAFLASAGSERVALPVAGVAVGAVLTAAGGLHAAAGVAAVALGSAAVLWLADRRLGGFTGDVLGAAGLVGEAAGLVAAAARR